MTDDPTRLLDDPTVSDALRSDLTEAASDAGPAFDVNAGLERLAAAIGGGLPDGSGDGTDAGGDSSNVDPDGDAGGGDIGGIESIPPADGGATAAATASAAEGATTASSATAMKAAFGTAGVAAKGAAATVGVKGAAAVAATKASVALWVGGGTAVALVAGGVALSSSKLPDHPPVQPSSIAAPAPPSEPKRVELPAPEQPLKDPEPNAPADEEKPVLKPTHIPIPAASAPDKEALVKREVAQLGQARAALGANPGRALALAEQGHREFRGGMLYQEREAVAILALAKLGRTGEARPRAHAFLRAYPKGPFSERIRTAVGRSD